MVLFILGTVGLTNLLVHSKILEGFRGWVNGHAPKKVSQVLECYQCCGFWVGLLVGALLLSFNLPTLIVSAFAGSYIADLGNDLKQYLQANSTINLPT